MRLPADIIVFANQKGGVGKTISISATASILTSLDQKVLMIDLDAQRNLDMVAGKGVAISRNDPAQKNILSVLNGECDIRDAIVHTEIGDLIRATNQLYGWAGVTIITEEEFKRLENKPEQVISLLKERFEEKKKQDPHLLEQKLSSVRNDYDFILIDTNPTLTLLSTNSLYAAQFVVIPAFSERSSAEAVIELYESIQSLKYFDPGRKLEIAGLLMTKFDPRSRAGKRHVAKYASLTGRMGVYLFDTKIRASAKAAEYVEAGMDIVRYAPDSTTAQDYISFAQELMGRINTIKKGWDKTDG